MALWEENLVRKASLGRKEFLNYLPLSQLRVPPVQPSAPIHLHLAGTVPPTPQGRGDSPRGL